MEGIGETLLNGARWLMDLDGGFSQMVDFGRSLTQVFSTIMIGVLVWFLAQAFGRGEVGALIKVVVICECVRILA